MTDKQRAFLEAYIETEDIRQAALAAGKEYLVRLYVTGGSKAGISNVSGAKAGAEG